MCPAASVVLCMIKVAGMSGVSSLAIGKRERDDSATCIKERKDNASRKT